MKLLNTNIMHVSALCAKVIHKYKVPENVVFSLQSLKYVNILVKKINTLVRVYANFLIFLKKFEGK
jgi:hypothetical protein